MTPIFTESDKELLKLAMNDLVFKYSEARDKALSVGIPVKMEEMKQAIMKSSGMLINDILRLEKRLLLLMDGDQVRT